MENRKRGEMKTTEINKGVEGGKISKVTVKEKKKERRKENKENCYVQKEERP
jgi:hypothetical protein